MKHPGERWRVAPASHLSLDEIDPAGTPGAPGDRAATDATIPHLHEQLFSLQDRLWGEARRSLLVVLQGMDTAGKDGTIKHVFGGVNPQGTRVAAFKQPTPEELGHDFLWRVHQRAPRAGEIGIFNRSHYEDVLIARVDRLVEKSVWRERFDLINAFERTLAHGGTTIIKVFLHISRDEQGRRLTERLERPDKRWKTDKSDFTERKRWDDYHAAYTEAIERTSTETASWYVVPADHKWYRNWAVSRILVETLKAMDPRFPEPPPPDVPGDEAPLRSRPK